MHFENFLQQKHETNMSVFNIKHYWRRLLCRVSQTLPSAFYRALGKEVVCRVSERKHSANKWHSTKRWFAECRTLGKDQICRVTNNNTRQRAAAVNGRQPPLILCRVSSPDTRQRGSFAECHFWHSASHIFFFTFDLQTFSAVLIQYLVLHVSMWHISRAFSIFF